MRHTSTHAIALVSALALGCTDEATPKPATSDGGGLSIADGGAHDTSTTFASGAELSVPVPEKGRAFVRLEPFTVVPAPSDPKASTDWDLAFEEYTITTNGGISGPGKAGAFGPLDGVAFVADTAPTVPFMVADKPAGAFLDWYAYEGAPAHALYSRFHVVGVKDGERLYKVQILSYYGERAGAPISALYSIRWAELGPNGPGPTRTLDGIDGTAGGAGGAATEPNEVVDLATGEKRMLTPAAALASPAWHLSFRRQTVTVNGGIAGPRGAVAHDLDAPTRAGESLDTVRTRSADGERAHFEAVTRASFDGKPFLAEGIVSAFGDTWVDRGGPTPTPRYATWILVDARGQRFLVGFSAFVSATTTSPGTVVMHRKPVPN